MSDPRSPSHGVDGHFSLERLGCGPNPNGGDPAPEEGERDPGDEFGTHRFALLKGLAIHQHPSPLVPHLMNHEGSGKGFLRQPRIH